MELGEQRAHLLEANYQDSLDSADVEQNPDHISLSNAKTTVPRRWLDQRWRGGSSWRYLLAVAVLVGVLCGGLGYTTGFWAGKGPGSGKATRPGVAPLRVMVAGDSISKGSEAMHTWRYRIWEWFQENDVPVVFVGPFHRTRLQQEDLTTGVPLPAPRAGAGDEINGPTAISAGYALDVEPEFLRTGSAHFAIWGREVIQDLDIISQQIKDYRPDYLLVELGFNDLVWASRKPDELLHLMEQFIEKARASSPELRFAVANVPQKSKTGDLDVRTAQYNKKLKEAIPKWSQPESPIELVEFQEAYSCGPTSCIGSVDGVHPNSQGEFEIAHAFSNTLNQKFGLGKQPLALPSEFPARDCLAPATVAVQPSKEYTRFVWGFVYGAGGYDIQVRRDGAEWATDSGNFTKDRHMDIEWTTKGKWEFRVRTHCELTSKSPWTDAISAGQ